MVSDWRRARHTRFSKATDSFSTHDYCHGCQPRLTQLRSLYYPGQPWNGSFEWKHGWELLDDCNNPERKNMLAVLRYADKIRKVESISWLHSD